MKQSKNLSTYFRTLHFQFSRNIQILNKLDLIQNSFPYHKIKRNSLNSLSLSFQQWRKNEHAVYSIYIKSNINKPILLPKARRTIKDGNIIIEDLTFNHNKNKQPIIDIAFSSLLSLIGRIAGIILALVIFLFTNIYFFYILIPKWFKFRKWRRKNIRSFKTFINNYDITSFTIEKEKNDFLINKSNYISDPSTLKNYKIWTDWHKLGNEKVPSDDNTMTTWKEFNIVILITTFLEIASISTMLGLWMY